MSVWPIDIFLLLMLLSMDKSLVSSTTDSLMNNVVLPSRCGFPGSPSNGAAESPNSGVVLSKGVFPRGQRVKYSCQKGFLLLGHAERTCQEDGRWTGKIPTCKATVGRGHIARQSSTLWSYSADMAVDGNTETCSFTPKTPDTRWWQLDLERVVDIQGVAITISQGAYQELTVFILQQLAGNEVLYTPCASYRGHFRDSRVVLMCGGVATTQPQTIPGRYIYIRDDRRQSEYFGLCEVDVFSQKEEVACGEPEEPGHGSTYRPDNNNVVYYSCAAGFALDGSTSRVCLPNGQWEGKQPVCMDVQCPHPPPVSHGSVTVASSSGTFVFGTVAVYSCDAGYYIVGNDTRFCTQAAVWSGQTPQCNAITCGSPPTISNADVRLVNLTTTWNSVAAYNCNEGYALNPISQSGISVCLETGRWLPLDFQCIVIEDVISNRFPQIPILTTQDVFQTGGETAEGEINHTEGPDHLSRENETDDSHRMNLGGVAALGVVGAILMCIMTAVGVVFAKRRAEKWQQESANKSPQSSINNLVPSTTSDTIYDDATSAYNGANITTQQTSQPKDCHYAKIMKKQDISPYAITTTDNHTFTEVSDSGDWYATLTKDDTKASSADDVIKVPDILCNVSSASTPTMSAVYAQVDKTKKKKYRQQKASSSDDALSSLDATNKSNATKVPQCKSDNDISDTYAAVHRPLPPLPRNPSFQIDVTYATLNLKGENDYQSF